jgi:hypothetical protein
MYFAEKDMDDQLFNREPKQELKKNFYCGDEVDYDEKCLEQCDRCVDAKGVDYGYLPKEIHLEDIFNDEKKEGIKKLIQKQKLIDMMEQDEQLGLYEEIKCYCGHTTICDCGPEEPKQEDMITKIMQMDAKMAYDSLPKQSTKDRILSETSEEIKQRVRDTANKLVMKQETLEEAGERINYFVLNGRTPFNNGFKEGAKWQQERSYSEEDLIHFYNFIKEKCDIVNTSGYAETHVKWFIEQFKKK